MENLSNLKKLSSFNYAIPTSPKDTHRNSGRTSNWFPRGSWSPAMVPPSSHGTQSPARTSHFSAARTSRVSSHFCDQELEDEEAEDLEDSHDIAQELNQVSISKLAVLVESKVEQDQPPNNKSKESIDARLSVILLDQGLFTVYKRLFVTCLSLNATFMLLSAIGKFQYGKNNAALFSIGNILALTLCRSEACLRVVFYAAVKVFGRPWVPLRIKTAITSFLQSLGGIHSGCGVSSIAWLIYAISLTLRDRENTSTEIIAVAYTILSLLCLSSLAAFPLLRHLHHNVFERTHRFAGWTVLALLWVFILLTISYDPKTKSYHGHICPKLIKTKEFWLTTVITVLIVLPWITVRRVKVKVSAPSTHASIIKFEGGVTPGILGRISRSPFSEWHAFGIISDGKKEHMMLAGAVGDFTRSLLSNPPSHLWVRTLHFAGHPYLALLYDRPLVVATGSGISVFLSLILQPRAANVCLLWVAKGIEQNFGKEIKEWVSGHPKEKVIVHDTAVLGRPDISQMAVDAARNWGAEVVLVTSNPEGSRDIVNACKAAGISAFSPIWDS